MHIIRQLNCLHWHSISSRSSPSHGSVLFAQTAQALKPQWSGDLVTCHLRDNFTSMADTDGENLTRRLNALTLSTDRVSDGQGAAKEDKQTRKQRKRRTKLHDEHRSSSLKQIDSKNAESDTAPNQRALRSSTTKTQVEGGCEKQPQWRIRNPMGDPKQFLLPRPAPTAQYLSQALQPSVPLQEPKKLLIILDLNGTLVHRASRKANSTFTKRPFCKQFMEYESSDKCD